MKAAMNIITILFGAFWLVFGMNNFFHFFPIPEPSEDGAEFLKALEQSGYVMPLVYGTQIAAGLLLMMQRFVPLALIVLGPIVANIALYDVFLNQSGLAIAIVIGVFYLLAVFDNRQKFIPLFKP